MGFTKMLFCCNFNVLPETVYGRAIMEEAETETGVISQIQFAVTAVMFGLPDIPIQRIFHLKISLLLELTIRHLTTRVVNALHLYCSLPAAIVRKFGELIMEEAVEYLGIW